MTCIAALRNTMMAGRQHDAMPACFGFFQRWRSCYTERQSKGPAFQPDVAQRSSGAQASREEYPMAVMIDEALDILHHTGPDLGGGGSNHAPMVAEALCTLDRPGSVIPWIEAYKTRFQERPQGHAQVSGEELTESLSAPDTTTVSPRCDKI
jgi:hypothetical protein